MGVGFGSSWVAGPNLSNTYDAMGRLQKLTDVPSQADLISNATYNPAGQLSTMTGTSGVPSEARTYNSIGQMTQLQSGGLSIQYAYSSTQNNGKITSEIDVVSGEQVTYTYDSLNRLASATSSVTPGWGQSYAYDGFGNLTTQTVTQGTAPALSVTYDPATNRRTGESADANGNICSGWNSCANSYIYDVENRVVQLGSSSSLLAAYSYAPGNKRVWRGVWSGSTQTVDEATFWGANGQKLTTYNLSIYASTQLVASATGTNYYFGGKLIKNTGGYVQPDRLGSIGKYFPYGQERPSATQDGKEKFATYFRDSETGLDYADQRYHQVGMGRFMTPDPYSGSVSARDPGSWNRYAYSGGDPVNNSDPSGLLYIGGISTTGSCDPSLMNFNPAFYQTMCSNSGPYDPNYDNFGGGVFAFDLGHVGPGSGNDPLAFSAAYDLNNGAPGFGPDPGGPPPQPDCQGQILNTVNNQFGTNFTDANVQSTFTNGGGFNLVINGTGLPASQFNSIQTGRYASGFSNAITGVGPSLHLPAYDAVNDPQAIFNNSNIGGMTSVTFTAHTDSAFAYNPLGALLHYILDVSDQGKATRNPCP